MRWMIFTLLAVVAVTLQTTLAPRLAVGGVWPDWMLVLAVFFALYMPGWEALIAAWALGALADLQSAERFGLLSLSYLAGAGLVFWLREAVFRVHPLTQFVLTALAAGVVQAVIVAYYAMSGGWGSAAPGALFVRAAFIALYTAAWAPLMHGGLLKAAPLLGLLAPPRSRPAAQPS